jgi:hypothetical protein
MTDLDRLEELAKAATAHLAGHDLKASTHGRMIFGQSKKGGDAHVLDIRGWGYLTGGGGGALGLSEEQAIKAQKAVEAYAVAAWNAVPELIALARRDGVSEPVAWRFRSMSGAAWSYVGYDPKDLIHTEAEPLFAHPAPASAPGDKEDALRRLEVMRDQARNGTAVTDPNEWEADELDAILAALRQPDTAGDEIAGLEVTEAICRDRIERKAMTADDIRDTITRWLNADDPTHWGEFEKRLARAVGMEAAEDASMARGEECAQCHMPLWTRNPCALGLDPAKAPADAIAQCAALRTTPADPRPDPRDEDDNLIAPDGKYWRDAYQRLARQIGHVSSLPNPRDEALREARETLDYAGGSALALAMSGKDHPRMDEILNEIFQRCRDAGNRLAKINAVMAGGEG